MLIASRAALVIAACAGCLGCEGFAPPDPPDPPARAQYAAIGLGSDACAIREDGTLACSWSSSSPPVAMPPRDGTFVDVQPPCAIRSDGAAVCWGDAERVTIEGPFERLARGGQVRCALRRDRTAACWPEGTPAPSDRLTDLAAGSSSACGVREDDSTLLCWSLSPGSLETSVPAPGRFTTVRLGVDDVGCAIAEDGAIQCWGSWSEPPPGGRHVELAIDDASFACAMREDGSITCWGARDEVRPPAGAFTQLSLATTRGWGLQAWALDAEGHIDSFGRSFPPPPSQAFIALASSCLQRADLSWTCINEASERPQPDGAFVDLAANFHGACGIREDGSLECWDLQPGITPPSGVFRTIEGADDSFCALGDEGAIECWGTSTARTLSPPPGSFASIALAGAFGCAIDSAGAIVCWGDAPSGIPTGGGYSSIDIAYPGGCALREGRAECFGSVAAGVTPPAGPFTDLAVGGFGLACGLLEADESIVCWSDDLAYPQAHWADVRFERIDGCNEGVCGITRDGDVAGLGVEGTTLWLTHWLAGR